MMKLETYKHMYFLGIGGIGMSALARYFSNLGVQISGYDRTKTELTMALENEGIHIHYDPEISLIPEEVDMVVFTPAVPESNPEFKHLKARGLPLVKRSYLVAQLVNDKFCIAVAGTHGKTTISSLITHILKSSGKEVLAFVGGLMNNYGKNVIFSYEPEYCVIEADEYDRSFLNLTPDIAVVSAMDADHLDIYGDYNNLKNAFTQFISGIKPDGRLVLQKDVNLSRNGIEIVSYGLDSEHGLNARNIRFDDAVYAFDVYRGNSCIMKDVSFPFAGIHNVENALAAVQVALFAGINTTHIKNALADFSGIHRRFEFRIKTEDIVYIDDYAHHPKEIDALINGVRKLFPDKSITGIFQPHLYTRTRDFAAEFAHSLEKLDHVIIMDIYPARELPIPGIDAHFLLNLINHPCKYYCSSGMILEKVKEIKPEVLLTIGAGDIDKLVLPLQNLLSVMKEEKK